MSKQAWICQNNHGYVTTSMVMSKQAWLCQNKHGYVTTSMVMTRLKDSAWTTQE